MSVGDIFLLVLIFCAALLMPLVTQIRLDRLEAERRKRFHQKYRVYYLEPGGAYYRCRERAQRQLETKRISIR